MSGIEALEGQVFIAETEGRWYEEALKTGFSALIGACEEAEALMNLVTTEIRSEARVLSNNQSWECGKADHDRWQ